MFKKMMAIGLIAFGAAGAAMAGSDATGAGDGERKVVRQRMHGPGLESAALHNIMAEQLSAKTGKTVAEIRGMLEKGGRDAFAELGIKDEEIRPLFKEARLTLISRMQAARLITPEQAEKARTAKVEMKVKRQHGGKDGPHGEHDAHD